MRNFLYFVFGFFLSIVLVETIFEDKYLLFKSKLKNIINNRVVIENSCEIEEVNEIPKNSIAIIGHAYERSNQNEKFISTKIIDFINANKKNLKGIIFSGDVFKNPSYNKWNKLNTFLNKNNIQFFVAPGNHDVGFGDNAKKDIFNEFFSYKFPFILDTYQNEYGSNVIIEDSTSNNWLINDDTIKIANLNKERKFIIRHNIPISELKYIANSLEGVSKNLPSIKSLSSKLKYETFIISGDTGSVKKLPRVVCQKFEKIIVVANGLGEVDNDKIIIISKNKLYLFNL